MASLSKQISKDQVIYALEYIIENNISLTGSTTYDLEYKEMYFPPKEVVRWAAKLAKIPNWENMSLYGGSNTNDPLKAMGFKIITKNNNDVNLEIISKYKDIVSKGNNNKELYKWELIQKFNGKPDIEANDFAKEISSINFSNLIYHNGIAVRNHIAKAKTEEYKKCFKFLYDESINLDYRIEKFQEDVLSIYRSMGEKLHHHHDERTISTFLTFKFPDKYPLYKNSFYSEYCKKLGIKQAKKNHRYIHYISLVNDFIKNYITKDVALLELKNSFLTEDCYPDEQNLIFAQDILYQVLGKEQEQEEEKEVEIAQTQNHKMKQFSLNQILYGPPGTGKTYNTINKAIEIANPEFDLTQDRNTIKQEYNRLVENGQIVFTTFHQSMTYEDFIEGIKPETKDNNVIYNIKNGLFKEVVSKSIDNWKKSTSGTKQTKPFDKVFQLLKDEWEENPMIEFPMKREGNDFKILGFSDSSINFLKASGTNNHTLSINTLRDLYYGIREFQNYGVGIYYPSIVDKLNSYDVDFESESINSDIKNFVIVIDEINRGNVSQIFGELITLIEEDKRLGNDEAIEVTLPYSKEKFGVPSNLYIIGTMNTADRSVEALDTALRRRFVFEEMPPKYGLEGLQQDLFGFTASHLLETINKRIEKLLDKDHQIGHAYFINKNEKTIIDSFYKNIIPLLQEYFFGDYGKIGLVLGAGFIKKMKQDSVFANFEHLDYSQFEEKESYEIINHKGNPENFGNAIKLLMNR
ncbi:AAA family ATPase [Empedobacter falsenii]|uniref:McrB family protein n=1 Tax=Empedobacter falsenii TaxID=343874 RepID=UPI003A81191D